MKSLKSALLQISRQSFAFTARFVAICGLVSTLLTACNPSTSARKALETAKTGPTQTTSTPAVEDSSPTTIENSTPQSTSQSNPQSNPQSNSQPTNPTPATASPIEKVSPPKSVPEPLNQSGGGGAGDAGGGNNDRPSFEDIRKTVARLQADTTWAWRPLNYATYQDSKGEIQTTNTVNIRGTPEFHKFIESLYYTLLVSDVPMSKQEQATKDLFRVEFKDQGHCESVDGNKEASVKHCDMQAPICMSLEYIRAMTPKATLEQSLKSLLMHELAHKKCADEKVAKQIERHYDRPAVQRFRSTEEVAMTFNYVRVYLKRLNEFSVAEDETKLCELIKFTWIQAQQLQNQVTTDGFVVDPDGSDDSARITLSKRTQGLLNFCAASQSAAKEKFDVTPKDRADLRNHLQEAMKTFDQVAQEFTKNSGYLIYDFSEHRLPDSNGADY